MFFILGYILISIFSIPSLSIATLINKFFSIDLIKQRNYNFKKSIYGSNTILTMAIMGPIMEEIVFRLWLSFKKIHVTISLVVTFWIIITKLQSKSLYVFILDLTFLKNLLAAIVLGILMNLFFNSRIVQLKLNRSFLYWISSVGFGLIHIFNFLPLEITICWVYPLLILPQIILGLILGFSRIKYGFFFSLLLHGLINLPASIYYFYKF
jgi:membrane protease YdiL (CAAX protease family)